LSNHEGATKINEISVRLVMGIVVILDATYGNDL